MKVKTFKEFVIGMLRAIVDVPTQDLFIKVKDDSHKDARASELLQPSELHMAFMPLDLGRIGRFKKSPKSVFDRLKQLIGI